MNPRANHGTSSDAPPVDAVARDVQRFGTNWVRTRSRPLNREPQDRLKPLDEFRTHSEEPGTFLMFEAGDITHPAANGRGIQIGAAKS